MVPSTFRQLLLVALLANSLLVTQNSSSGGLAEDVIPRRDASRITPSAIQARGAGRLGPPLPQAYRGHQHLLGRPCEDAFQRAAHGAAVGEGDAKFARHRRLRACHQVQFRHQRPASRRQSLTPRYSYKVMKTSVPYASLHALSKKSIAFRDGSGTKYPAVDTTLISRLRASSRSRRYSGTRFHRSHRPLQGCFL